MKPNQTLLAAMALLAGCATAPERITTTEPPQDHGEMSVVDPYSTFNTLMNVVALIVGDLGKTYVEQ